MGLQVDAVLFDDVVCNNQHGAEEAKERVSSGDQKESYRQTSRNRIEKLLKRLKVNFKIKETPV